MNSRLFFRSLFVAAALTAAGCGGGGGGGGVTAPPAGSVTISGVATDGPVAFGDVTVFPVKQDGTVDRTKILITGKTAADGSYRLTIPPALAPSGPIVVEVTGGTYTDDLSGTSGLTLRIPLRGVVSSAVDGDKITVTPLTEMAYEKAAGAGLTPANIDDANLKIGQIFGVDSIVRSRPFNPTQPAPATATADDKKYAGAMGAFDQMVTTAKGNQTLDLAMKTLMDGISADLHDSGGLSVATVNSYNAAVTAFTTKNNGATLPPSIALTSGVLTLSTTGLLPLGTAINGVDVTITLPANVTVKADAITGETLPGVVTASGQAVGNSFTGARYVAASGNTPATLHLLLLNVQPGFSLGEFVNVAFDGFPDPNASFGVTVNQVSGGSDPNISPVTLPGIGVTSIFTGL
jgi:hypothetical protein